MNNFFNLYLIINLKLSQWENFDHDNKNRIFPISFNERAYGSMISFKDHGSGSSSTSPIVCALDRNHINIGGEGDMTYYAYSLIYGI